MKRYIVVYLLELAQHHIDFVFVAFVLVPEIVGLFLLKLFLFVDIGKDSSQRLQYSAS